METLFISVIGFPALIQDFVEMVYFQKVADSRNPFFKEDYGSSLLITM
jgi:hypothetical protein